jgi:hypothetical protein
MAYKSVHTEYDLFNGGNKLEEKKINIKTSSDITLLPLNNIKQ